MRKEEKRLIVRKERINVREKKKGGDRKERRVREDRILLHKPTGREK